jgi:hypothetical protein
MCVNFLGCCTILHDIVNKRNVRTTPEDRIRIHKVETLSDDLVPAAKDHLDYRRRDGSWQRQTRETYDRGNGATILLYNREQRTVSVGTAVPFPDLRQRP